MSLSALFTFWLAPFHWLMYVVHFAYECVLLLSLLLLPSSCYRNLDIVAKTLPRDLKLFFVGVRVLLRTRRLQSNNCTAYSEFRKTMMTNPDKVCFIAEDKEWTFKMVDDYANKVANAFEGADHRKGDVVALLVSNRPEFVCLWLGLSRLGVISAFINVNLRGESLKHCISSSGCKTIVFSEDLASSISEIRGGFPAPLRIFQLSGFPKIGDSLETLLSVVDNVFTPTEDVNHSDRLAYVYTSGTTGMPKAAIVTHARYLLYGTICQTLLGMTSSDIFYVPLPLYHVAGGLLCMSTATNIGVTCVIPPKFSASNFFPDCVRHKCTMSMFIGEMCRYILSQSGISEDIGAHSLRMIISTGLRATVWEEFSDRFRIRDIVEIYGATEGNVQLVNTTNTVGAVGFVPQCLPRRFRRAVATIVRCDVDTLEPLRDSNGFCIECEVGEVGMLLGLIKKNTPGKMFHGYVDGEASKKRILKRVYQEDDEAYITGDLMSMDRYGYVYFKDRTGDTYRWKGENVSSFEVETVISKILGGRECVVYGVEVGDLEGKAGMVAVMDPQRQVDLFELVAFLEKDLPRYAVPVFVRIVSQIDFTGTWRLKKTQLKKEGFDPNVVSDPLYFKQGKIYIELTKDSYKGIVNGAILV